MFRTNTYDEAKAKIDALDRSLAIIEFGLDGKIITANKNFTDVVGYTLSELAGRSHSIFLTEADAKSPSYGEFWAKLRRGEYHSGEFPRLSKSGERIWLQATYNPIMGADGKPCKIVKFASDITQSKNEVARLKTMIDGMPVAVMTADPKDDFRINYLNQTSRTTLGAIEQYLPIKISDMVGSSIDVFHKNPRHQREMLKDASHLPHNAKIKLGPETLNLQVSAIHDPEGNYVGPMLTWSVVTAQVQMANEVARVVELLSEAVQSMKQSAEGLTGSADAARQRASSVAAGSEQMNSSIHEISDQVDRVSQRAQQIATQAGATDTIVRELAENATKVDTVVGMIKSIADQTNLLALNATIEAARAGEAGRGFAVVASEVKQLASQTAKATDEITQRVGNIQSAIQNSVSAIEMITDAVNELSSLTVTMASAVQEQTHSTQEMSNNISGVSTAANETGKLAETVGMIANDLAGHSEGLGATIQRFIKSA